jgi:hypothetical protein
MERMPSTDRVERFTCADHWDYAVLRLRQLAAGHDLVITGRMPHAGL